MDPDNEITEFPLLVGEVYLLLKQLKDDVVMSILDKVLKLKQTESVLIGNGAWSTYCNVVDANNHDVFIRKVNKKELEDIKKEVNKIKNII